MTEYIASSPLVGRRPRIPRIARYSSSLRPSAPYGCSLSGVAIAFETVSATPREGVVTVTIRKLPELTDAGSPQSTGGRTRGRSAGGGAPLSDRPRSTWGLPAPGQRRNL